MKECEIRPQHIFDEYLRLASGDIRKYFSHTRKIQGDCPACGVKGKQAFKKNGFDYCVCPACKTLYVNPRPPERTFKRYYLESRSSKYWAETFYKETAIARRRKLWRPKAAFIARRLRAYKAAGWPIIDIGGGYGIFAEEMRKYSPQPVLVIEPAPHLARICKDKGLPLLAKFLENVKRRDLPSGSKVFVSFELLEHLYCPKTFLKRLLKLMLPGDLFIFTTLSGMGIDIQLLWRNSKSVYPPHHLNFFNPASIRILLLQLGFKVIEVTTPGKLDVDIMLNNRFFIKDRFWKTFLASADESQRRRWQRLISDTGWSSHMMVISERP